jgi:hypothetical protein
VEAMGLVRERGGDMVEHGACVALGPD